MADFRNHPDFPIDWRDLYGRIPDEEIISEFAMSFVRNGEKLIHSLTQAIDEGQPEQIEMYAHAMKGSSSNIGAIRLAKAAWQIEKAAAEKHLDGIPQLYAIMEPEFFMLRTLLNQVDWIQQAKDAVLAQTQ
jgi:histidine phosphotransfer protein HptB